MVTHVSTTNLAVSIDTCTANNPMASRFPSNASFYWDSARCLAFARVTYHMAVGKCQNCPLSSLSTVQNNSVIAPQPDLVKSMAAPIMGNVTNYLHMLNSSLPLSSVLDNVEDYIAEVLLRAYSGAWTAMMETGVFLAEPYYTNYSPALSSLQARVDLRRMYAWLSLQISVTIVGVIFIAVQPRSQYPLIGDMGMAAFDLDANDAPRGSSGWPTDKRLIRVEPKADGWKIVIEPQTPKDERPE